MTSLSQLASQLIQSLDYPFGWLLSLPRDLSVFLLALVTTLLMVAIRKRFTNQELLRRARSDIARLKVLIREAKSNADPAAVQRLRRTETTVKMHLLRADLKVLAIVILPVALLVTWAAERFDYCPLTEADTIRLTAYFSPSSTGKLAHVVPNDNMEFESTAIQEVAAREGPNESQASATWELKPTIKANSLKIEIRHQDQTVSHHVQVGTRYYHPPRQTHGEAGILATEVRLQQYRWLGFVPGIDAWGIAPWMVGYLAFSLALVPILRRVLKVS